MFPPLGYRGRRDNYRGPPRGGGPASASSQHPVYRYDSEFDFESANARFNKDDLEEEFKQKLKVVEGEEVSNGNGTAEGLDEVGVEEIPADGGSEGEFYDKSKSFFDSISCESNKAGAGRYVSACVCMSVCMFSCMLYDPWYMSATMGLSVIVCLSLCVCPQYRPLAKGVFPLPRII